MRLYNTLSRKIEELAPSTHNEFKFYSCGQTVYDYTHIGHGRKYVNDDLLKRTLYFLGYKVKHVQNITDVGHLVSDADEGEDKIEKGARKYGKSVWDIVTFYTNHFNPSMKKLNIVPPDITAKATDHVPQMVKVISALERNGMTYQTDQALYFDTTKFASYGTLSGQNIEDKKQKARSEVRLDPDKKHPADFALWFKRVGRFKDHIMHWSSPWGSGFPGWHIECSAMSMQYLGDTIDIHSGGVDHIPVHHENEIAQSEAATGKQFVRYWFHSQFLMVDGTKMSKSLNNFYTIEDIERKGFSALALRYLYLQTHYRQVMNFTWEALAAAQTALNKIGETVLVLQNETSRRNLSEEKLAKTQHYIDVFKSHLASDLQVPAALAMVYEVLKSNIPSPDKLDLLYSFDEVLGLRLRSVQAPPIPVEIERLAQKRQSAKQKDDFALADKIRKAIEQRGFTIDDTPSGYRIRQGNN